MRKLTILFLALAVLALVSASPPRAVADTFTYNLTVPNTALGGYSGPFGTVTVDRTSTTSANITFAAATGFLFTDGGAAGVNVNATSWLLSNLTGTFLPGFKGTDLSNAGSGNEDGFGNFNQKINEFDSFSWALTGISFTLTDTSGTWSSANSVLVANNFGFFVAAHMGACGPPPNSQPCSINTPFGANTGFVGNGTGKVPEPGMLTMLLAGVFPLGGLVRRLRRA